MPRIQYEITKQDDERIKKLMEACGERSKRIFLDAAIDLMETVINKRKKKKRIGVLDKDWNVLGEIIMPLLGKVKED